MCDREIYVCTEINKNIIAPVYFDEQQNRNRDLKNEMLWECKGQLQFRVDISLSKQSQNKEGIKGISRDE